MPGKKNKDKKADNVAPEEPVDALAPSAEGPAPKPPLDILYCGGSS
jgi:hypothetical protein